MPGLNVRGDRHLNFTREEAAAWLGEVPARQYPPNAPDIDAAAAPLIGIGGLLVALALIGAAFYGSTQRQMPSDVTQPSVQSRTVAREGIPRTDLRRQQENLSPPQVPPSVAHMPGGWFYGRMHGQLPLHDREGRSIGVLPDGASFFGTGAASEVQIIVAADASSWGYGGLEMPDHVYDAPTAAPIKPEFEKAAHLIGQIEASGIAEALRRIPRPEPEYGYLPAGWTIDCLEHDEPLTYGVDGIKIGMVRKGTCLLYEIADVRGWRLVVSPDGSYRGYAHIPWSYEVPKRTPMQPEYQGGVALIRRLASGSMPREGLDEMRQAFAKNAPTPLPGLGEEE